MKPSIQELTCIKYARNFYPEEKEKLWKRFFYKRKKQENILVSSNKSFSQLWNDYGAWFGNTPWTRREFVRRSKLDCMQYWVQQLYGKEINVIGLEKEIQVKHNEEHKKFMDASPSSYMDMRDAVDGIPKKIDELFGDYEK
jgi:hypothetical protein